MYQFLMMQNNHNLEQHMVQLIICQKKKLCVGLLNNLEDLEIL